jgi:hypothetical protein
MYTHSLTHPTTNPNPNPKPQTIDPIAGTASSRRNSSNNPFQSSSPRIGGSGGGGGGARNASAAAASASSSAPAASDNLREGQRERSIAMVNEGLEGLLPRASQLLQLGGSVFLAFAPFILAIALLFAGIYSVFGDSFVHGGEVGRGLPAYIDADALLAEPTVDPRIPFR